MPDISTDDLMRLHDMFDKQDRLIDRLLQSVDQLTATVVALTPQEYVAVEDGQSHETVAGSPRFLGEGTEG